MPHPFSKIVIDARPTGSHGPWADRLVLGQSMLHRHIEAAQRLDAGSPQILNHLQHEQEPAAKPSAFLLRTDRLYDTRKLQKAYRKGTSPESAVVWRLDQIDDLDRAGDELRRRTSYQPLGRYWAWPLACKLARSLKSTPVRPNTLTLAAAVSMMAASACLTQGTGWRIQLGTAGLLALGLVLDTADGHLARIQGTASEFGRWLDAVLDEFCDLLLHGAIAWSFFARSAQPGGLLLGMAYMISKYVFQTAMLEDRRPPQTPSTTNALKTSSHPLSLSRRLRPLVHLMGHADIRWHTWILFALIGRLDLVLWFGVAYFSVRVAAMVASRAVSHV